MTISAEIAPIELAEVRPMVRDAASAASRDLSLIGHVQVKLEAFIGQCQLPVSRLMALSSGDVLALTAGLDDPITLRLNDKPIARGELVAVDDHFGIRISEIL